MKKLTTITAIIVLILLSACGSENSEANETIRPVDTWSPFVQIAPPGNIWETRSNEAINNPLLTPSNELVYIGSFQVNESHWHRIMYERQRVKAFFPPDVTHPLFSTMQEFPDFIGGFLDAEFYTAVLIVQGKENEAAELLAYIEDFETIEVRFVPRSFNELTAIQTHIVNSNVKPQLWFNFRNELEGYVDIQLFDYSDEEKAFFREFVIDSPLVRFSCVFEVHGNQVLKHFPFHNPVFSSLIHENQLEGVYISSHVTDDQSIAILVYIDYEIDPLHVRYMRLKYYNNGRWIPLLGFNPSMFSCDPDLLFSPGLNIHEFKTAHFTRNFEGFHQVEFLVTEGDLFDRSGFHLLSYVFHNY